MTWGNCIKGFVCPGCVSYNRKWTLRRGRLLSNSAHFTDGFSVSPCSPGQKHQRVKQSQFGGTPPSSLHLWPFNGCWLCCSAVVKSRQLFFFFFCPHSFQVIWQVQVGYSRQTPYMWSPARLEEVFLSFYFIFIYFFWCNTALLGSLRNGTLNAPHINTSKQADFTHCEAWGLMQNWHLDICIILFLFLLLF